MQVIQTELSEAIADLAAMCPGASIHLAVHQTPFETFALDDVKGVHVVTNHGRSWLHGTAETAGYRVEFYSVDLPQAAPSVTAAVA
jgi:hypothetical protein